MVTPTDMDVEMLMLGGMYAPTDDVTLMAMVPYVEKTMDHVTMGGTTFETETEGLGDVRLTGMFKVHEDEDEAVLLNLGISVPTGDINERDQLPMSGGTAVLLPYPMQLGTGTWDVLPGITYTGQSEHWSWGAQGTLRYHLGENNHDYRRGNRRDVTGWVARRWNEELSTSARVNVSEWDDISGADPGLAPTVVPTANTDSQGGQRVDLLLGANWYLTEGELAGNRLAFEFGWPLEQDLDGPQLETDWFFTIGWQFAF